MENHGSETGTINSVTVYIRARQDRSAGNTVQSTAKIALKIGSTTYYGNEEYLTEVGPNITLPLIQTPQAEHGAKTGTPWMECKSEFHYYLQTHMMLERHLLCSMHSGLG